jgi:rubredoxin
MGKFERYRKKIVCPECKLEGHAVVEEEENPVFYDGLHPRVVSVSEGFRASDPEGIVCCKCKVRAKEF